MGVVHLDFGQILPRRSFSEVVKPPPPPPSSHTSLSTNAVSSAPRVPPGLPPGLEDFIEQENYSSSDDSDPDDEDERPPPRVPPKTSFTEASSSNGVSLRGQYRLAEEEVRRKALAAEERKARREGLRGSLDVGGDEHVGEMEDEDDSPLLGPDEKPRAWHFVPIHKDDDDDAEGGDAVTALRRLEGAVDPAIAKAIAEKLEAMIRRAKERTKAVEAGADYSHEDRLADEAFLAWVAEEEGKDEGEVEHDPEPLLLAIANPDPEPEPLDTNEEPAHGTDNIQHDPDAPPEPEHNELLPAPVEAEVEHPTNTSMFVPEFPVRSGTTSGLERYPAPGPHSGWLPSYDVPGPHKRSWILDHRSDTLARHFSIIDRDLLKNLHFDRIVSLEWARPIPEITVYDWEWFMKWDGDRKNSLKEAPYRSIPTISSVSACRASFNLVLMWTATEIVLTPAGD